MLKIYLCVQLGDIEMNLNKISTLYFIISIHVTRYVYISEPEQIPVTLNQIFI